MIWVLFTVGPEWGLHSARHPRCQSTKEICTCNKQIHTHTHKKTRVPVARRTRFSVYLGAISICIHLYRERRQPGADALQCTAHCLALLCVCNVCVCVCIVRASNLRSSTNTHNNSSAYAPASNRSPLLDLAGWHYPL